MKEKVSESRKRRKSSVSILVTVFVLALTVYFIVTLIGFLSDIGNMRSEYAAAQAELAQLNAQNEELSGLLEGDGYIERIARDKYNYVLPGEEVYVDLSGN